MGLSTVEKLPAIGRRNGERLQAAQRKRDPRLYNRPSGFLANGETEESNFLKRKMDFSLRSP